MKYSLAVKSQPPPNLFELPAQPAALRDVSWKGPRSGETVRARHRNWLVEEVFPPPNSGDHTRVRLVCLDDDNRGAVIELLWELELGAEVRKPEDALLSEVAELDPPDRFAAYVRALRWQGVSAADADRFQSPFRAGIQISPYQLTPLQKALSLPRANLFIADDVGLGKTIEAGLVLQELLLRQRVDFALIVCPASVTLQWRDEMEQRFGLSFEVFSRDFLIRRQTERGFGVNAWATHNRFIVELPPSSPARVSRAASAAHRRAREEEHADSRRSAHRRAFDRRRRPLCHRLAAHPRGARHRASLRKPPVPQRHAPQRALEQLLGAS